MAAASWPAYARIQASGYELGAGTTVARTELDDGAVRQARTVTRPITQRTVVAEIPGPRLLDFRAWAEAHAARYFLARDLDGQSRGMRVVGGVGGITYRQVTRRSGPALWEASLVLEDAGGVAGGAPFFASAALSHVLATNAPLVLPAVYGGTAPVKTRFVPALPAGPVLAPATRTLSLAGEIDPIDEAVYRWQARDADDRTADVSVTLSVGRRISRVITRPSAGTIRIDTAYPAYQAILPAHWFAGLARGQRYIDSISLTRAGQVTLSIGPTATTSSLLAATAARLRLRLSATIDDAGTIVTLDLVGPGAASATRRDLTEPYVWQVPNAAECADFVDALPDGVGLNVVYWRAA